MVKLKKGFIEQLVFLNSLNVGGASVPTTYGKSIKNNSTK